MDTLKHLVQLSSELQKELTELKGELTLINNELSTFNNIHYIPVAVTLKDVLSVEKLEGNGLLDKLTVSIGSQKNIIEDLKKQLQTLQGNLGISTETLV